MTRTSSSAKKVNMTKMELKKLKSILPTLKQKSSSSPIEIVLETIRYIRQLEEQLLDQFPMSSIADLSIDSSSSSLIPLQDIGNSNWTTIMMNSFQMYIRSDNCHIVF